jgi:hypothetical protein
MRQNISILLLLQFLIPIQAQIYKIVESKHFSDNSKDCRIIGDCFAQKYMKNDTLYLTIYFNNNCRDLTKYRDTLKFNNNTLNLIHADTNRTTVSFRFNKTLNKIDTFYHMRLTPHSPCIGGYDIQKGQYKIIGFKNIPNYLKLDYKNLCDCPNKPFKFDLYNNDTINMIDANGKRQGLWMTFFNSGKVHEKKYFDNGIFKGGKTFDENGNDLYYVSHSDGDIQYMIIDTIKNK